MTALTELDDNIVRSISVGAVFSDFINSLDFHHKDDLLVTASEDDFVRLYDIANAKLLKTTYHKKHGTDRYVLLITQVLSYVLQGTIWRILAIFYQCMITDVFDTSKGTKKVVSLCMPPINDSFMSGSVDHSVRIWDLRVNGCQDGRMLEHAAI